MEVHVLDSMGTAFVTLFEPLRLAFLFLGVLIGLVLGVVPGVGGLVGLTLLLPFTFSMDPYTAMAFMMGLAAVGATSDSIPAILFGVPGSVGSAATVLDGYPMARRGEAGRALGAAFAASVLGGLFGAVLLAFLIPALRPAVLAIAKPEMLAISIFGLSLAASLAGKSQTKGLIIACVGLILACIGENDVGELRWTLDTIYLYDGLPIVPVVLGLFALPEIAELFIQRSSIAQEGAPTQVTMASQLRGFRDMLKNWFLVLRCSVLGSLLGAIPGIGAPVIDWVAYGHALRTEKGAPDTFGKGDVRGVLASESSNNAKEGGALVPTIAFGIPGSASMVLFLAALIYHGVVPGPAMLTTNLDVTYTLVWSIALANVLAAGICFAFANHIARIALVRIGLLTPLVIVIIYLGAFEGKRAWGDLGTLLFFGAIGFSMKRLEWPRPPLILGMVLGLIIESNAFITANVYGWNWWQRPITLVILCMTLLGLAGPVVRFVRRRIGERGRIRTRLARAVVDPRQLAGGLLVLSFFVVIYLSTSDWEFRSYLMPRTAAGIGIALTLMMLFHVFVRAERIDEHGAVVAADAKAAMDNKTDLSKLGARDFYGRLALFAGWCIGMLLMALTFGLLPACLVFLFCFLRFQAGESWKTSFLVTLVAMTLIYILFHLVVRVSWAPSYLGDMYPWVRSNKWLSVF